MPARLRGTSKLAKLREEMRYMQDHVATDDPVFQQSLDANIAQAGQIQRGNLAARLAADPVAAQQYLADKQAEIATLQSQAPLDPEGTNRHLDDLRDEMAYLQRQTGLAANIQAGLAAEQTQASDAQASIMDAHLRADPLAQNAYADRMRKLIDQASSGGVANPADAYADLNRMFNQMARLSQTAEPALQASLAPLMDSAKAEADRIAFANPAAVGNIAAYSWAVA